MGLTRKTRRPPVHDRVEHVNANYPILPRRPACRDTEPSLLFLHALLQPVSSPRHLAGCLGSCPARHLANTRRYCVNIRPRTTRYASWQGGCRVTRHRAGSTPQGAISQGHEHGKCMYAFVCSVYQDRSSVVVCLQIKVRSRICPAHSCSAIQVLGVGPRSELRCQASGS